MAITGILLVPQIIITVVMIFLGALLLMLSAKIFKLKNESYITPLKVIT